MPILWFQMIVAVSTLGCSPIFAVKMLQKSSSNGNTVKAMTVARQKPGLVRLIGSVVAAELAALLVLVAILWILHPQVTASAFWGGMVFIVPNTYLAFYAFRHCEVHSMYSAALSLGRGQTGKILLVAAGFALAFRFVQPLHPGYLFGGYICVLAVHIAVAAKISKLFGDLQPEAGCGTEE